MHSADGDIEQCDQSVADARLRWRCRRGTKELDLILSAFATRHYPRLTAVEQRRFARLLDCADPQLADWLCGGATPDDPEMASIVERILSAGRG
ncbi:MAG: succinate dehydrogenase assembly factor 2 [bacterium]